MRLCPNPLKELMIANMAGIAIMRNPTLPPAYLKLYRGRSMNADYKGYRITASAEHDESTGLWNGRYRILDSDGIVTYESFTTSLNEEGEA